MLLSRSRPTVHKPRMIKWATVLALWFLSVCGASETSAEDKVIFAGRLLDVRTGKILPNRAIRVKDGTIVAVGAAAKSSLLGNFVDLSDFTVLPGLIDVHTHLCDNSHMGEAFDHWAYPAATFGIVGATNARKTLRAGFTTVRDLSSPFYADIALRDAINAGWTEGPRMFVTGPMITITGGHGAWGNWIGPQHKFQTDAHAIADGADEVRKAVRTLIKYQVDWIKVAATGGFGTYGSIPGAASYSVDELRAAVEEAGKRGLKVAAHAHGLDGIKNAIDAGVASIEHGTMLDDAGVKMLRDNNVFLVMDLLAAHYDLVEKNRDYADKALERDNSEEFQHYLGLFAKAHAAGVKLAFGSDAGIYPHGRNAEQFALMVQAGLAPVDAIRTATIWAAELLEQEEKLGAIEVGKWADLIAVAGDPLNNVEILQDVKFVMKEGAIYRQP